MGPLENMRAEPQAIEVEVVEVDGMVPASKPFTEEERPFPESGKGGGMPWGGLQGRVLKLDSKWWPVWALLGIVAVFFLLTFGLVIGALFLVAWALRKTLRMIFR